MSRPRSVSLLALVLLASAAYNLLGVANSLQRYTLLSQRGLSLPAAYLVARDAAWGVTFALLAAGLWGLRAWGRAGTLAALPLYLALGWVERLGFMRSDYARVSIPYFAALHVVVLAFAAWALLRRRAREAFRHGPPRLADHRTRVTYDD